MKCGGFLASHKTRKSSHPFTLLHERATIITSPSEIGTSQLQLCGHHQEKSSVIFRRREMEVSYIYWAWFMCDNVAAFWQRQLNFWLFEVVLRDKGDHMSLESPMYRRISAWRNSSWSQPIIWMEWMSSLCGYPLCQRALCHILSCAPCVFCLSLHYSIP